MELPQFLNCSFHSLQVLLHTPYRAEQRAVGGMTLCFNRLARHNADKFPLLQVLQDRVNLGSRYIALRFNILNSAWSIPNKSQIYHGLIISKSKFGQGLGERLNL